MKCNCFSAFQRRQWLWLALALGLPAADAANVTIQKDTDIALRLTWLISPIDVGFTDPPPTFDIPVLNNWEILEANYSYHAGGTPSDVKIRVRHTTAPHADEEGHGPTITLGFSFPYVLTPPGGIGGFTTGEGHHEHNTYPTLGHPDKYILAWGYSNLTGPPLGGALTVILDGKHVPDSLGGVFGHAALLGMLALGTVCARRAA